MFFDAHCPFKLILMPYFHSFFHLWFKKRNETTALKHYQLKAAAYCSSYFSFCTKLFHHLVGNVFFICQNDDKWRILRKNKLVFRLKWMHHLHIENPLLFVVNHSHTSSNKLHTDWNIIYGDSKSPVIVTITTNSTISCRRGRQTNIFLQIVIFFKAK